MKKTVSLLLCLLMLLSMTGLLSGCSSISIVGKWTTVVDYTDEVAEILMDGTEDIENFFSMPSFPLRLNMEFYDDSTFVVSVDESELNNSLAALDEPLRSAVKQYFNSQGLDLQALESLGTGIDNAMQYFYGLNIASRVHQAFYLNGTYKLEENTLYLNDHPTNLPDGSSYVTIELTKTELVFKDCNVSFESVPGLAEAINAGLRFTRTEK